MAGTAKTSKLSRVAAAPAPTTPNFFVTGLTLRDGAGLPHWEPSAMNSVSQGRHAFTNQGGADGILPVATTVKIYETLIEVSRNAGQHCVIQLINSTVFAQHHRFESGFLPPHTGDLWHWVHDPPIEFTVPANHLLLTRVWLNDSFHRIAVLYIGTRS